METRLTLRPGRNGTEKLVERYGERLVRVRYLYDPQAGRRLKTVELIVESIAWRRRLHRGAPQRRRDRRRVRIAYQAADLRERAKRLGISDRVQQPDGQIRP